MASQGPHSVLGSMLPSVLPQGPHLDSSQDLGFSPPPSRDPAPYTPSPASLRPGCQDVLPGCQEVLPVLIPPCCLPGPTLFWGPFSPSVLAQGPHLDSLQDVGFSPVHTRHPAAYTPSPASLRPRPLHPLASVSESRMSGGAARAHPTLWPPTANCLLGSRFPSVLPQGPHLDSLQDLGFSPVPA